MEVQLLPSRALECSCFLHDILVHRLRQPCRLYREQRGIVHCLRGALWRCGCCHLVHMSVLAFCMTFLFTDCGNRAGFIENSWESFIALEELVWRCGCCHLVHLRVLAFCMTFLCTDCGNRAGFIENSWESFIGFLRSLYGGAVAAISCT